MFNRWYEYINSILIGNSFLYNHQKMLRQNNCYFYKGTNQYGLDNLTHLIGSNQILNEHKFQEMVQIYFSFNILLFFCSR